jgi:hypothetical protein
MWLVAGGTAGHVAVRNRRQIACCGEIVAYGRWVAIL